MSDEREQMELRAIRESQGAMLKAQLKACPNDAFLASVADLTEVVWEMRFFILEETRRRGLDLGEAAHWGDPQSRNGVEGSICCVNIREPRSYAAAKCLLERAYELVVGLFGKERAKEVGLALSPGRGRFLIDADTPCGEQLARLFVGALRKNFGPAGISVREFRATV